MAFLKTTYHFGILLISCLQGAIIPDQAPAYGPSLLRARDNCLKQLLVGKIKFFLRGILRGGPRDMNNLGASIVF